MTFKVEREEDAAVRYVDADGVRTITLNRPDRLNAIGMPMILALEEAILSAQQIDDVHVLLLRGAGRAFCAGDDVNAQSEICGLGETALREQLLHLQNISRMLMLGDKIAVAEVHGWAIGAGFSWALNCDFRVWGEAATAFLPEVTFGSFVTGGATFLLPKMLGPQTAADMLFLGKRLRPSDENAAGLVHSMHPEDQAPAAAKQLAQELAMLPPPAARRMKRALGAGIASGFRAALEDEIEACVATTLDPRTLERMRAAIDRT